MDDKVSKWLLEHWYQPYFNHPNMLYVIALARFFNLPESLCKIQWHLFYNNTASEIDWETIKRILRAMKKNGKKLYNAAYMVRGNSGRDKVASVIDYYIGSLIKANVIVDLNSMERTHARISEVFGFGSFMAGQITADLRWAIDWYWRGKTYEKRLLGTYSWDDCNSWAPIGPGSQRGMNILLGRDMKAPMKQSEFNIQLQHLIERLQKTLPAVITERLEAMDYQNCMCELSKYSKALSGLGRPKQIYKPSDNPS
jgi:hypothetical protein